MIFTQILELHFQMLKSLKEQQEGKGDYMFRDSIGKRGTGLTVFQRKLICTIQDIVKKCLNFSVSELATSIVRQKNQAT